MKVLSLYVNRNLTILRRVIVPFSVLVNRGHSFYAQQCATFTPEISYAYDVTVLSNWVLSDEELERFEQVAQERTFVYDLSDPLLLQVPQVQHTLESASLVTVPNAYIAQEVRPFNKRISVLPSTFELGYFMVGRNTPKPTNPVVGCFGPHDWYLVKDAIKTLREKHPHVTFLGDGNAQQMLGDLVQSVDLSVDNYPLLLASCTVGLCPFDGNKGFDTIWGIEYGTLCKPTITANGSPYQKVFRSGTTLVVHDPDNTQEWVEKVELLLGDAPLRAHIGKQSFDQANGMRSTRVAGQYLREYQQMLPSLTMV